MLASDARPKRPAALFDEVFGTDRDGAFVHISTGIGAILDHAAALLDDAGALVEARRFDRAEFLMATAQEEIGKAYILIDMCRVDFSRHEAALRRLCRAFYDHVIKHVYFELCASDNPGIWELEHVRHYFHIGIKDWWPAAPESGEPDMPHDTYFLREANLYVDFDSYAGTWNVPHLPSKSMLFESMMFSPLTLARRSLERLRAAQSAGLIEADALRIFNQHLKTLPITDETATAQLTSLYQQAGQELETTRGVPLSVFLDSALRNWPLYWLLYPKSKSS